MDSACAWQRVLKCDAHGPHGNEVEMVTDGWHPDHRKIFGNYLAGSGFGLAKVAKFHSRIDGSG